MIGSIGFDGEIRNIKNLRQPYGPDLETVKLSCLILSRKVNFLAIQTACITVHIVYQCLTVLSCRLTTDYTSIISVMLP
jgi:hypothetical protein